MISGQEIKRSKEQTNSTVAQVLKMIFRADCHILPVMDPRSLLVWFHESDMTVLQMGSKRWIFYSPATAKVHGRPPGLGCETGKDRDGLDSRCRGCMLCLKVTQGTKRHW